MRVNTVYYISSSVDRQLFRDKFHGLGSTGVIYLKFLIIFENDNKRGQDPSTYFVTCEALLLFELKVFVI